jgi:hypothetical protein
MAYIFVAPRTNNAAIRPHMHSHAAAAHPTTVHCTVHSCFCTDIHAKHSAHEAPMQTHAHIHRNTFFTSTLLAAAAPSVTLSPCSCISSRNLTAKQAGPSDPCMPGSGTAADGQRMQLVVITTCGRHWQDTDCTNAVAHHTYACHTATPSPRS